MHAVATTFLSRVYKCVQVWRMRVLAVQKARKPLVKKIIQINYNLKY